MIMEGYIRDEPERSHCGAVLQAMTFQGVDGDIDID
jgi:hypothetical protein